MSIEDMARFALAILWGGALCGGAWLMLESWLRLNDHKEAWRGDAAAITSLVVTLLVAAGILWTLSAADLFHFWSWVTNRRPG